MQVLTQLSFGLTHRRMCSTTSMLIWLLLFHGKLTTCSLVQVSKIQIIDLTMKPYSIYVINFLCIYKKRGWKNCSKLFKNSSVSCVQKKRDTSWSSLFHGGTYKLASQSTRSCQSLHLETQTTGRFDFEKIVCETKDFHSFLYCIESSKTC
jgi:hypothetical protein